jgi:hypothetical protein
MATVGATPIATTTVPQTTVVATPADAALAAAVPPARRGLPTWTWVVIAAAVAILVGLVVASLIYYLTRGRNRGGGAFRPVVPAGARIGDGRYLIRWGPAAGNLYLGVASDGSDGLVLVPRANALVWTYDSTSATADRPGGRLLVPLASTTSPTTPVTYALTADTLARTLPASVFVTAANIDANQWYITRGPGTTTATDPGVIFNTVVGGCLQPPSGAAANSPISLVAGCTPTAARAWYFEAAPS